MSRLTFCVLLILAGTAALAAPPCTCDEARMHHGWCDACAIGYVAAVEIRSRTLFEVLDAHGHDIDPASMECVSCRKALAEDGFCESCRWGFVKEQLYFSRLTWVLARGVPTDPATLACPTCRTTATAKPAAPIAPTGAGATVPDRTAERAGAKRWCAPCRRGFVGNVAFTDRRDLEIATREYARLLIAVRTSRRCETCAVVMYTGGRCPTCVTTDVNRRPPAD